MGKSRESSIRWTGIVLTQLGYAINLVLTFATATLGFTLSLLRDKDFAPPLGARRLFELALAALLASIIVGVACVVNRLTDFRASRRIATRREKLEEKDMPRGEINEALSLPRRDNKDRGDRTWKWFRWQIGAFTVGVVALALSLLFTYSVKLGLGAS
jgi:hypothetical protein